MRNHTSSADPEVRVLKTGSCPSLSGKSKLQWEFGCRADGSFCIHVAANTGAGYFNDDWIAWAAIAGVFDRHDGRPITSSTLGVLYQGRSANSGGFLLAALKDQGLVGRSLDNRRTYRRLDGSALLAEMTTLSQVPTTPGKAAKAVKPVTPRKR